jgi:cation transport ATPase
MERLHPTLSPKEQRRADARAKSAARMDSWSRIEQSPERQLLRDYVDTRWTVAEFMLPLMILLMALSMISIQAAPQISYYVTLALWPLMIMAIINVAIMWRGFKKLLAERHPGASTKGLLMYMMNRSIMLRRFRQPGPRIKRGDPI